MNAKNGITIATLKHRIAVLEKSKNRNKNI